MTSGNPLPGFTAIDGWFPCPSHVEDPDRIVAHPEMTGARAEARGWQAFAGETTLPPTAQTTESSA